MSAYKSNGHAYPARGSLTGLLPAYPSDDVPIVLTGAFSDGYDEGYN